MPARNTAANFVVAADDGIDLAGAGEGGEVAAVFFEGLEFPLGILVGDALVAAKFDEGFEDEIALEAVGGEDFLQAPAALFEDAEEEMLRGDEVVLELGGVGLGGVEGLLEILAGEDIGGTGAGDFDAAAQLGLEVGGEAGQGDTELLEKLGDEALRLLREGEQEVVAVQFLM